MISNQILDCDVLSDARFPFGRRVCMCTFKNTALMGVFVRGAGCLSFPVSSCLYADALEGAVTCPCCDLPSQLRLAMSCCYVIPLLNDNKSMICNILIN